MAKKRGGLGRGIGALIPQSAPDESASALEATPSVQDAELERSQVETAGSGAESSTIAADSPESPGLERSSDGSSTAEEVSTAARPVDMFFSTKSTQNPGRASRAAADLAEGWARDARKSRNSRTSKDSSSRPSASAQSTPPRRKGAASASHEASKKPGSATKTSAPATADSDDLVTVPGASLAELPIDQIRENPRNPRTVFDEDELNELAYSLQEVGVLQPIVVRPLRDAAPEAYEIVMGERRWRAAQRAGLRVIPAIIRDTSDDHLLRDALLENLHRAQLNPLEEAAAYGQLLEDFGCTQDELSERIGRSRPQISNTLRLLRLPPVVQRKLASGAISAGHARALLAIDHSALQEELAERIVSEGLSVRAVERLLSQGSEMMSAAPTTLTRRSSYHPQVVDYTSRLSTRLETPVRIDVGKRKGKVTLEFTNLDDLERLLERLGIDIEP